jgi:hypothetical protein
LLLKKSLKNAKFHEKEEEHKITKRAT